MLKAFVFLAFSMFVFSSGAAANVDDCGQIPNINMQKVEKKTQLKAVEKKASECMDSAMARCALAKIQFRDSPSNPYTEAAVEILGEKRGAVCLIKTTTMRGSSTCEVPTPSIQKLRNSKAAKKMPSIHLLTWELLKVNLLKRPSQLGITCP